MDNYKVTRVTVQEILVQGAGLTQVRKKQVTFYVGANGPFYLTYDKADYNAATVQADIQKEVTALQAIGATGAGQ